MTFIPDVGDFRRVRSSSSFVARRAPRPRPDAARPAPRAPLEIVDRPEARRVNTVPMPRGGGLAVARRSCGGRGSFLLVNQTRRARPDPVRPRARPSSWPCCSAARSRPVLGAIDDLLDLRARWQLARPGRAGPASRSPSGSSIDFINNPFGPASSASPGLVAAGFTVFWIVGMINSINLIDGLDGLSSGIAFIAAVTLGIISLTTQVGQPLIAVLCFALAGALLGFLRWNFHPATIFAGTSGVQFVGYTLAVLAILGTAKVAVALLVLGVPIIDTFWIIVRRLSEGRSPFSPDRGHIHHRLLDLGLSHRQTVLVDLRHLPGPGGPVAAAVGRHAALCVPRRLRRLRAGPVRADARRVRPAG